MNDNYLLTTEVAGDLYYGVAKQLPIIDYHNHLSVEDIAENKKHRDLTDLWLSGDPYKHRAMRICGVNEDLITGSVSSREKFNVWCKIYPKLVGGPLFDWSRMELSEFFSVNIPINTENADVIWNTVNDMLALPEFQAGAIYNRLNIEYAAPCTSLLDETELFASVKTLAPSLRGDNITSPDISFLRELSRITNVQITDLDSLKEAISLRLDIFHSVGCRFSDHALDNGFAYVNDPASAENELQSILRNDDGVIHSTVALCSHLLVFLSEEYAKRGWVMQLHIGAQRYTSSSLRKRVGAAGGYAGIGNSADVISLTQMLDDMEQNSSGLPKKVILYTINPADNALFSVLSGSYRGVTQGPAWWWCDHLQGMRDMLNIFSCYSVLSTFVGMTTDSRSLLSMLRHDYFRRTFCGWVGEKVKCGEFPDDISLLSELTKAVCYGNAQKLIL